MLTRICSTATFNLVGGNDESSQSGIFGYRPDPVLWLFGVVPDRNGRWPMKQFRVIYRWQNREYQSVFQAKSASGALMIAEVMLMVGAKPFGIEVAW